MVEFIIFASIGLLLFIYSVLCYKKKRIIYTIKLPEFYVVDDRYFDLQLKISILSSIVIIAGAAICLITVNKGIALLSAVLLFWVLNYVLKYVAFKKGLISHEENALRK